MNHLTQSETWYWRIQASTFIRRLNERTVSWIREYEKIKNNTKNDMILFCLLGMVIKGREMILVNANVYKEAINIISIGMKK